MNNELLIISVVRKPKLKLIISLGIIYGLSVLRLRMIKYFLFKSHRKLRCNLNHLSYAILDVLSPAASQLKNRFVGSRV